MDQLHARISGHRVGKRLVTLVRIAIDATLAVFALVFIVPATILAALVRPANGNRKPVLLFGALPIKSLSYTLAALTRAGYSGSVVATESYLTAGAKEFGQVLARPDIKSLLLRHIIESVSKFSAFTGALFSVDIFHYFFDGGILRRTLLEPIEPYLLKLAGKELVLFPYGSDAFVYDQLEDHSWRHALLVDNGIHGNRAAAIERRVRQWCSLADVVVGSIAHIDNLPRWDVLPVVWYPIDTDATEEAPPETSGPVRICHAPNHRGAKGTEFLLSAIESLRAEGFDIELDLIEGVSNAEALERIGKADILVDQLLVGYALTALEGLAMGKLVISGLEGSRYQVFRRYSYLDECPIVKASPESIEAVLRDLLQRRQQWPALGAASRSYAQKRHSYAASAAMWDAIYRRIWHGEEVDLINLYHPLMENDPQTAEPG